MKFSKMHGLGNDFVLINGFEEKLEEPALVEAARKLCDRHFGIGADGLIVALPSRIANFRMRVFNPDGFEPEMCGNGIRCFAQYVRRYGLTRETTIEVETLAGIMRPQILGDERDGQLVRVDMGQPRLNRKDIPVRGDTEEAIADTLKVNGQKFEFTAVSMGNPHCIIFVADVQNFPVDKIGPQIEHHNLFPRRTNVEFAQVVSNSQVKIRVWERSAGETLACGTGACATAVACALNNRTGRKVNIELSGGSLFIEWTGDNRVLMTGPAVEVFAGDVQLS